MTRGAVQDERRGIEVLVRQHQRSYAGLTTAGVLSGLDPPRIPLSCDGQRDQLADPSSDVSHQRAPSSAGRVRGRKVDWRHRKQRTSFDGMHTLASSEDEDPITYLPGERWTLEDVSTGRPARGLESSPLDRFTGIFDTSLPEQPNTLSSAYSQRGVDSFRKRIQVTSEGHVSLDLSGRLGCAQQIELLPGLLQQLVGQPLSLNLSSNALKPTALPALSKLLSSSACTCLDLSSNSDLLASALCPTQAPALAAFFLTSCTVACRDSMLLTQDTRSKSDTSCEFVSASEPTALSALLLNSCQVHPSAAEVVAASLLQQHTQPPGLQGTSNYTDWSEEAGGLRGVAGESSQAHSTTSGLKELHLASASLDDAAFAALLSPRTSFPPRQAECLVAVCPLSCLRALNLAGCAAAGRGMPLVAAFVAASTCLELLDVSDTGASSEGCAGLCRALWANTSLTRLYLASSNLSWPAALTLALAVRRHHPRLALLDLQACQIPPWGLAALLHACASRRGPLRALNIAGCRLATPPATQPQPSAPAPNTALQPHLHMPLTRARTTSSATGPTFISRGPASGAGAAHRSTGVTAMETPERCSAASVSQIDSPARVSVRRATTSLNGSPRARGAEAQKGSSTGSGAQAVVSPARGRQGTGASRSGAHIVSGAQFPASTAGAQPFLQQALSDTPRFVAKGNIAVDLDTPGGVAQALNCLSLWHTGSITLRQANVSGSSGTSSQALGSPLTPLSSSGVLTARVAGGMGGSGRACASSLADMHGKRSGGRPGVCATGQLKSATAPLEKSRDLDPGAGGKGHQVGSVDTGSLQLSDEMFGGLLDQLQSQLGGWGPANAAGSPGWASGAGGTGGSGWRSRPGMVATSEVWQRQVAEAVAKAGVNLSAAQVKRWRAAGLPGLEFLGVASHGEGAGEGVFAAADGCAGGG